MNNIGDSGINETVPDAYEGRSRAGKDNRVRSIHPQNVLDREEDRVNSAKRTEESSGNFILPIQRRPLVKTNSWHLGIDIERPRLSIQGMRESIADVEKQVVHVYGSTHFSGKKSVQEPQMKVRQDR